MLPWYGHQLPPSHGCAAPGASCAASGAALRSFTQSIQCIAIGPDPERLAPGRAPVPFPTPSIPT